MMTRSKRFARITVMGIAIGLMSLSGVISAESGGESKTNSFTVTRAHFWNRSGQSAATIVISKTPARAAEFAARELQEHIYKITGAELPIVDDQTPFSGNRILVGESELTRKLGLNAADFKSQEYLVRIGSDTVVLMGKDEKAATNAVFSTALRGKGKWGNALNFTGRGSLFNVSSSGFSDDEGSLEAWVYLPEELPSRPGTILRLTSWNDPVTHCILVQVAGTRKIQYRSFGIFSNSVQATENNVLSQELKTGWHHVMGTHSIKTGKIELLVDGVSQGSAQYNKSTCSNESLYIGGFIVGSGIWNSFRGMIDEIRVSKTVRPVSGLNFNEPPSAYSDTTLLLHCDETAGPIRDMIKPDRACRSISCIPELHEENGSMYAAYDFLEKNCGVRWYAPGDIGLVYPQTRSLIVAGGELRRTPGMRYRVLSCPPMAFVPAEEPISPLDVSLWCCRMRMGGEQYVANHSFYGYYDRFWKKNPANPSVFEKEKPEFFAKGYSEAEMNPNPRRPNLCYSNPELVKQVVQDARDYFDGKGKSGSVGDGNYFSMVPMDMCPYCKCPECQAQMDPAEPGNTFSRNQTSNYIWGFVNAVAKEIGKTHPGKYISALAYYDWAFYPTRVKLEPNVSVQMCLYTRDWWGPSWEKRDMRVINDWVNNEKGKRPFYLWLYYLANYPYGQPPSFFPPFYAHTIIKQMRMFNDAGINGLFVEPSAGDLPLNSFLYDQLELYVTYRLAYDPALDGQKLVEDFFADYYGRAAKPMRQLYFEMEEVYSNSANYPEKIRTENVPHPATAEIASKNLATPERMARWAKLMAEAKKTAATDIEKKRVSLFERAIWNPMLSGRAKYLSGKK